MSRLVPAYRGPKKGQAFIRTVRLNDGNEVYLGKYGSPESRVRYAEEIAKLGSSSSPAPIRVGSPKDNRLAVIVDRYTDHAKRHYSNADGQTKEYTQMVRALDPLVKLFGSLPGDQFRPLHLVQVQEHMLDLGTLCRQTINHRITRIRRMFRWASKFDEVPETLYWSLKCVDPIPFGRGFESDDVEPVGWQVVVETLPWLTSVVADMVQTQLLCGMRPQDVCRMSPGQIDRRGEVWVYRPAKHKLSHLKKIRLIAIPPFVQPLLEPYLDRADGQCLFSPRESYRQRWQQLAIEQRTERKTKIYPSELRAREKRLLAREAADGRKHRDHFDTDSYRRSIAYGLERAAKAGVTIPHWHPHQLRHTISTKISQTLGEQEAQRWLGHERLETTGIYTQRQLRELLEIARKLEATWSASKTIAGLAALDAAQ